MCGIAGIGAQRAPKIVQQMLETIAHRGPDGQGVYEHPFYTLGHARLAMLDRAGGAQPMSDRERDTHIVFNGEIYNHLALRKSLPDHTFRSRSDTETLLYLACSGRDCREWLQELEGMFAFAV